MPVPLPNHAAAGVACPRDRRTNASARAALDRLERVRQRTPGGLSLTAPFEGVRLTFAQQLVAALYADGCSRRRMADALACSPHTIKEHVRRIALLIPGDGPPRERIVGWVQRCRLAADRA